jgi:hypothetical protein
MRGREQRDAVSEAAVQLAVLRGQLTSGYVIDSNGRQERRK